MEYLSLIGIAIVIIGFALKIDSILTIMVAMVVTALAGGMNILRFLEVLGSAFVANRNMAIFILIMLVTGTLERNGLKESAAKLIGKIKHASAGLVISAYGVMRAVFGAFNVGFGGVAGFVSPVVLPMATGAVENKEKEVTPEYLEEIKGMSSAMENVTWFFFQVLFVGGSGALLVQGTLRDLGYEVPELGTLAALEIPVAIISLVLMVVYTLALDKRSMKKYYPKASDLSKEEK